MYTYCECELQAGESGTVNYIPAAFSTLAIPTAIKDIPGYGVSASTASFPGFGSPTNVQSFGNLHPNVGGYQGSTTITDSANGFNGFVPLSGSIGKLLFKFHQSCV